MSILPALQSQLTKFIGQVQGKLIVSCQALPDEPLYGPEIMARMAIAAVQGGAAAIRANTPQDIRAICDAVRLPVIGLYKVYLPGYDVYITPTVAHAREVADAGATVIAVDGTLRPHPEVASLAEFFSAIHAATGRLVMADVATFEEGVAAEAAGADLISTTLSGYTPDSPHLTGPDLELVRSLAEVLRVPLLAEGRYYTPELAAQALNIGATAVVVGGAITRPQEITRRFVAAIAGHGLT